jgi:hypothetical protein
LGCQRAGKLGSCRTYPASVEERASALVALRAKSHASEPRGGGAREKDSDRVSPWSSCSWTPEVWGVSGPRPETAIDDYGREPREPSHPRSPSSLPTSAFPGLLWPIFGRSQWLGSNSRSRARLGRSGGLLRDDGRRMAAEAACSYAIATGPVPLQAFLMSWQFAPCHWSLHSLPISRNSTTATIYIPVTPARRPIRVVQGFYVVGRDVFERGLSSGGSTPVCPVTAS